MSKPTTSLAGSTRPIEPNKAREVSSYRPFLELDCCFSKALYKQFPDLLPLVLCDVGAARGFDPRWSVFGDALIEIGFEPEPQECKALQAEYEDCLTRFILPYALSNESAMKTLYITKDADASSLLRPNLRLADRMPDPSLMSVVKEVSVQTIPLDEVQLPVGHGIDVMKLDVQGGELDVLKGAVRHIHEGVLAVVAEAAFTTLYEGQPLFADIDIFLRSHGFQLMDIYPRRWRRKHLPPQFDALRMGQLIYGDALYLKDPIEYPQRLCQQGREREKLIKLVALAEFFSIPDYGIELVEYGKGRGIFSEDEQREVVELLQSNQIVNFNDCTRK